jgi:glycosyltransferase involved in cell wall biosynthesis
MDNPKVTVCLPTFNKARYLPAAIESVLTQEFHDYELLLVNDASPDQTDEIVRGFKDSRIRYIRNPQNLGLVENWNRCLNLAKGDYAIVFHDDDVMLPRLLRREVGVLDANPTVVLVHAAAQSIDESGAVFCVAPPRTWPELTSGLDFLTQYWSLDPGYVVMPSAMFRRSLALKLGAFNPDLKYSADADLWQRLAFEGQVAFLDDLLISNRIHASQTTQKILTNSLQMLDERLKHARTTRRLVAAHGGNLDRDIGRHISRELAVDLPELRRWNASISTVMRYGQAAVRAHPQVIYSPRFLAYFGLSILPPPVIRWLKRAHIRRLSSGWAAAREDSTKP